MTTQTATLSILGGEAHVVPVGDNLFRTLRGIHVFVPSICGGNGFCGQCKVRVVQGDVTPPTDKELRKLTAEEIAAGWRLACQVPVQGDMMIELPEATRDVRLYSARVSELEMANHDMRRVRLELDTPPTIRFLPGAFILVDIPPAPGAARGVTRSYSIATPPSLETAIELNVRLVPGGIGSGYIHNTLTVGDMLAFSGPYSGYSRCDDTSPLLCAAGGSGMAPVLSILRHLNELHSSRKIVYFFGAKTSADLCYMDELQALEKSLPDFTFIPVVEQPTEAERSLYETGLVTEAIARRVSDASDLAAYLCGSSGMLNACCEVLSRIGLRTENVFFDKFG